MLARPTVMPTSATVRHRCSASAAAELPEARSCFERRRRTSAKSPMGRKSKHARAESGTRSDDFRESVALVGWAPIVGTTGASTVGTWCSTESFSEFVADRAGARGDAVSLRGGVGKCRRSICGSASRPSPDPGTGGSSGGTTGSPESVRRHPPGGSAGCTAFIDASCPRAAGAADQSCKFSSGRSVAAIAQRSVQALRAHSAEW